MEVERKTNWAGVFTMSIFANLNNSSLRTVLAANITSNLKYAHLQSCLRLPTSGTGLEKPSVAQLAVLSTVDKRILSEQIGRLPMDLWQELDDKLRHTLGLH